MQPARLREVIAANIRRHAERRGLGLTQLAGLAGVAGSSFYEILSCEASVRADTLAKIAEALDIMPRELLDERTVDLPPARRRR